MNVTRATDQTVLELLESVAPRTAAALLESLDSKSAAAFSFKYINVADEEPVIAQMVAFALKKVREATVAVPELQQDRSPPRRDMTVPSPVHDSLHKTGTSGPQCAEQLQDLSLDDIDSTETTDGRLRGPQVNETRTARVAAATRQLALLHVHRADLPAHTLACMRLLLFGHGGKLGSGCPDGMKFALRKFPVGWLGQGLTFSDTPGLKYMLIQHKGGPCGPLAGINAEAIRFLYYCDPRLWVRGAECAAEAVMRGAGEENDTCPAWAEVNESERCRPPVWDPTDQPDLPLDPPDDARDRALILALGTIIWRCRPGGEGHRPAWLVVPDSALGAASSIVPEQSLQIKCSPVLLPPDGVTDRCSLFTCTSLCALMACIESHAHVLFHAAGPGLVSVLYSCLLTRGCASLSSTARDGILGDVDEATLPSIADAGLIGAFAYASQEVVNLVLTGRASSNVIDGVHVLSDGSASTVLQGVRHRADVGFLSVLAPLGNMAIGRNMTAPRAPVWVCFGESHYSFLFSAPKSCLWPTVASSKPKYTFGRIRSGPFYPATSSERCVGTLATSLASPIPTLFDILYADGLAKQDGLVRLTVQGASNGGPNPGQAHLDDTVCSSMDLWAACCWPGCKLAWNDIDPWEPLRL